MKTQIMVGVIAMMSYLFYQYVAGGPGNLTPVKASDGKLHQVQDLPNKDEAAETMANPLALAVAVVAAFRYFYGLGVAKKSHVQAGIIKKQPIKRAAHCGGKHQPWRNR